MPRILDLAFVIVTIGAAQAGNDSPRFTDVRNVKQSVLVWPANTPLTLKCKAEGTEPMTVHWFKDEAPLRYSSAISQESRWNLRLRKPQLSDNGIYTCVVSNAFGKTRHSYNLRILKRVQSAPVLIRGYPKPQTVRVGDSVELECIEEPNGRVSDYRWLKADTSPEKHSIENERQMKDKRKVEVLNPLKYDPFSKEVGHRRLNGVKLRLENVSQKDRGYYSCFVSNDIGFTYSTAYLNVTPISPTDPPEFIIPKERRQQYVIETEGKDVKLSCLVRGGAPLEFRWLFNGQELRPDDRHEMQRAEMVLKHVIVSDMGIYTCAIRNNFGSIQHNFKLHVLSQEPPYPVLLPGYPKNQTGVVGETVSLYCEETGEDTFVDYRWLKWHDSRKTFTVQDLLNNSLYSVMDPRLHEMASVDKKGMFLKLDKLSLEDEGLYTCLVTNNIGYAYRSAYLRVKHPMKKQYDRPVLPTTVIKKSNTQRCLAYEGKLNKYGELVHDGRECEVRGPCGTIYNKKRKHWQMFCDSAQLCKQNGVAGGGCVNITVGRDYGRLCCCDDNMCNRPASKAFVTSEQKSSSVRKLPKIIFMLVLTLGLALLSALLTYRIIRRRKAAMAKTIVHNTRPSRKFTKRMIMETKWLKEGV